MAGSLSAAGEAIGVSGSGSFTQSGGTNTTTGGLGGLILGVLSGSGTYNLSGGSLLAGGFGESIGGYGSGTFTQSGGTNTVTTLLKLGSDPGGSGTYSLTGTGSLSVGGPSISANSAPAPSPRAAVPILANSLTLGESNWQQRHLYPEQHRQPGGDRYGGETIGNSGTSVFIQSGGTNTWPVTSPWAIKLPAADLQLERNRQPLGGY